jgi:lysophospholipase L1-like esterase
MRTTRLIGAGVIGTALIATGALVRAVSGVQARAAGDVEGFLALPPEERSRRPVVACIGASIVRGRAGVDFVRMLREEFPEMAFANGGVNGHVAWEALQAMDDVIACAPNAAIVLIGTNDIQATLAPDDGEAVRRSKNLPQLPSPDFFGECLTAIIDRLQAGGTRVAVCSLPPLGQDLADLANVRTREFNRVIEVVCESRDATYLPVNERLSDILRDHALDDGPAFTGSWRPGLQSLVQHFVGRRSFDAISEQHRMLLSPDGVHLNTEGASVVANLAGEFLAE